VLQAVVPIAIGQARVEGNGRGRSVLVYGTTDQFPATIKAEIAMGDFLPAGDPRRGGSVAVLGPKIKQELFGEANALGQSVRIAGSRLRVIGHESRGRVVGMDIDGHLRLSRRPCDSSISRAQEITSPSPRRLTIRRSRRCEPS
jgi:putative ABC transport system permease protein